MAGSAVTDTAYLGDGSLINGDSLSASVNREEDERERPAAEYLAKTRFHDDTTRRVFWFVQQELGRDELEDGDVRSRTLVGPGLFLLGRDRLTLKLRGGVGYQYKGYSGGGNSREPIASAGWDYTQLMGGWLHLTHEFTLYPEVTNSPGENFVLESALGAAVPIADSDACHMRASLEHEYSNNPEADVEELDTAYRQGNL